MDQHILNIYYSLISFDGNDAKFECFSRAINFIFFLSFSFIQFFFSFSDLFFSLFFVMLVLYLSIVSDFHVSAHLGITKCKYKSSQHSILLTISLSFIFNARVLCVCFFSFRLTFFQ